MNCSFEYYDEAPSRPDVPEAVAAERRMAAELAAGSGKAREPVGRCCYCGCDKLIHAFDKDGIGYSECPRCRALIGDASEEGYKAYRSDSGLSELRGSGEYQDSADVFRSREWDEFCQWLTIRCHMYAERGEGLSILDIDDRYEGLRRRISSMGICTSYEAIDADQLDSADGRSADVVICYDLLQRVRDPSERVGRLYAMTRPGALLVFNARLGTSFDLRVLGPKANIVPYEHGTLPSEESMNALLTGHGIAPLNFTVTGDSELWWVLENKDAVAERDGFVSDVLNKDEQTIKDLQYFLQKNGYGTDARIIARRGGSE